MIQDEIDIGLDVSNKINALKGGWGLYIPHEDSIKYINCEQLGVHTVHNSDANRHCTCAS